jgi:hypothetical protein
LGNRERVLAFRDIADRVVSIESRTNLLFSFEKMALRDAVRSTAGARLFAIALYEFLHAPRNGEAFERWCAALADCHESKRAS